VCSSDLFCIHQILEKKWEYNKTVHQLFTDFKKAYDSIRREVLHNILIEFGVPMKLVGSGGGGGSSNGSSGNSGGGSSSGGGGGGGGNGSRRRKPRRRKG
jgi:uncharacterized membrane protein YgcG